MARHVFYGKIVEYNVMKKMWAEVEIEEEPLIHIGEEGGLGKKWLNWSQRR